MITMIKKKEILLIIGDKLRTLRISKNITQEEIARCLNIKRATYTNWENARTEIPLDILNKIAIYYEVSLDYMFNFNNKKSSYNKDLNYDIFATNLNTYLKKNNLKIESLAIDASTTISTIWAYLHNKVHIRTIYLYLICQTNNLSVDCLFSRK